MKMKTKEEISAAYLDVFGFEPSYVNEDYRAFEVKALTLRNEVTPAEIVKFAVILGTDNMKFDFETEKWSYSEYTGGTDYWNKITIYKDYWGWLEDLKRPTKS